MRQNGVKSKFLDLYPVYKPEIDLEIEAIIARWLIELDILEGDAKEVAEFLAPLNNNNWQYSKVVDRVYSAFIMTRNYLEPPERQYTQFYRMLHPALIAAGHLRRGGAA